MYNAKKVIPVIIGASETVSKSSENTWTIPAKKMRSKNYRKKNSHFVKDWRKSTKRFSGVP